MYENNASEYESVGPVLLRRPLHDNLTVENRLWRNHIDPTTAVMNHSRIINVSISRWFNLTRSIFIYQP